MKTMKILFMISIGVMICHPFIYKSYANHQFTFENKLIILANDRTFQSEQVRKWTTFLVTENLHLQHSTAQEFGNYKEEKYIVVLGGPNEGDGIGDIIKTLLTKEEQDWVNQPGYGKMYIKHNVWQDDQTIIIFAGHDQKAADAARVASKKDWWPILKVLSEE